MTDVTPASDFDFSTIPKQQQLAAHVRVRSERDSGGIAAKICDFGFRVERRCWIDLSDNLAGAAQLLAASNNCVDQWIERLQGEVGEGGHKCSIKQPPVAADKAGSKLRRRMKPRAEEISAFDGKLSGIIDLVEDIAAVKLRFRADVQPVMAARQRKITQAADECARCRQRPK